MVFPWFLHTKVNNTTEPRHYFKRMCLCGAFKNGKNGGPAAGRANRTLQAYRSPHMSNLVLAFKWGKALSYTVVWRWELGNHGTEEQSEQLPSAHHLLNHSFKATQLKSGSFRVTVDGVPKALEMFLHKEKITCQLVKAVTKNMSSNDNLSQNSSGQNWTPNPKRASHDPQRHSRKVNPTSLMCVWMWLTIDSRMGNGFWSSNKALAFFIDFNSKGTDSAQTNSTVFAPT